MPLAVKRWTTLALALLAVLLCACALTVYVVDPFEQYRESRILPRYDQQSYHNPGIQKNYAYDAVILGTSMIEMSHPSVIDACFGVQSVKLPMRGSYAAQMGWQLTHVLADRPLKLAILAVDAYSLMGRPDQDDEIHDFLWNDNPLDDVNYLLNGDVLMVEVPRILQNIGKPLDTKRDDMYQWVDVVYAEQSVLDSLTFSAQQPMQDVNAERSRENITRHLLPSIAAHPETTFCIYLPPYSVGYWYLMTRGGLSEQQFCAREQLCTLLMDYPNVQIFDYSSRVEWITELDSYFDYSHHSPARSDDIMRAMAAGEGRVTTLEDIRAGNARIRDAVEAFAQQYEPQRIGG